MRRVAHSSEDVVEQSAKDFIRIKIFSSRAPRAARVTLVVGFDDSQRLGCFVYVTENLQAVGGREDFAEAGVLHDDRSARREITRRAATEPPAAGCGVNI